jgi:DNA-binding response OmpR family regulator
MKSEAFLRIEKLTKARIDGYDQWDEVPLIKGKIIIARPDIRIQKTPPDIKLVGDDYISRKPVEISYLTDENSYILKDHGTSCGTYLNSELIENDGRPYRLKDYDLIGLARVQGEMRVLLRFRLSHQTIPVWFSDRSFKPDTVGLTVNVVSRKVFVNRKSVSLTPTEWKLMEFLYTNRGNVCSCDDIAWEVWGKEGASSELIAKYIQKLRDKIELDRKNPQYIKRHSTGGYVLEN